MIDVVLSNIKSRIKSVALKDRQEELTYASTLCFLCINKKNRKALSFVLGDSRIYSINQNEVKLLNPVKYYGDNLTCTTLSEFACDEVGCSVKKHSENTCYFLCTDGCWKELFYINNSNQIKMRETEYKKISDFLAEKKIADDCSFLYID